MIQLYRITYLFYNFKPELIVFIYLPINLQIIIIF